VLTVLPLAVNIDPQESLPSLALRLANQLKKMRRHQRYDAEQIVRDSGKAAGDEALFGPVLNVKVFDYQLDIDGVEAITHTLATGPVNDLELALFPDEQGELSMEILANKQRYDEATLTRHVARLNAMLVQFAANPDLRCGEVETSRASTIPGWRCRPPRWRIWSRSRRAKRRTPPRWRMRTLNSAIVRCASRSSRWQTCCARAA